MAAVITLPLNITTSKEYAALEWLIGIAITLSWLLFGCNILASCQARHEKHRYGANWFYIVTFLTMAVLHIVNSNEMPVILFKSYSGYDGVQDALVQWWHGHNAMAFFQTMSFLGLMYHFLPKAANRLLLLPPVCNPLLVAHLYLYLGWSAQLAIYLIA